jgi:hypothetical protein
MHGTRVQYKDAPADGLTVRLIQTWRRGDIDHAVMSASSGPKDYVKNVIFALFEANSRIDTVLMVRASGPPFLLVRAGRSYFDMSNKEVEGVEELCASSV